MKKLDKKITLALEFKKWYAKNKKYAYNSSNNKYYYDLLYELLIIQDGLCAYTEYRLIETKVLNKLKKDFVKGKNNTIIKPQIPAHLEHFDKKHKQVSAWDWKNFFASFEHVNVKKNRLEDQYGIDTILKPDLKGYDPGNLLNYDADLHMFYPKLNLTKSKQNRVKNMILVLGLNNDFIKMKRSEYLSTIEVLEFYREQKQIITQFHTAYGMISEY